MLKSVTELIIFRKQYTHFLNSIKNISEAMAVDLQMLKTPHGEEIYELQKKIF